MLLLSAEGTAEGMLDTDGFDDNGYVK